ncbi:hypothetical protein [Paenibacillus sp. HB172176]|uniref:hypothetical protein n=1 Tax=Paenibacillus sp. HB172176 TaxID=2493690 RepID=UPI00143C5DA5|nr:hypothetical protein [Paenibacillus sp. HB172176]
MEKHTHITVMKRTLALSYTCLEAINHLKTALEAEISEGAILLFGDLIEAFIQIEDSLQSFDNQLPLIELQEPSGAVRTALEQSAAAFESNDNERTLTSIHNSLQPAFESWKSELERILSPFLAA